MDTLKANQNRCVGMAANMIGVKKRIIIVNMGILKRTALSKLRRAVFRCPACGRPSDIRMLRWNIWTGGLFDQKKIKIIKPNRFFMCLINRTDEIHLKKQKNGGKKHGNNWD